MKYLHKLSRKFVPEELVFSLSLSKDSTWLSSQVTFTVDSDTLSSVIDSDELHTSNGTSQRSVCFIGMGSKTCG